MIMCDDAINNVIKQTNLNISRKNIVILGHLDNIIKASTKGRGHKQVIVCYEVINIIICRHIS